MTTKFAQHHPGREHATLARSLDRLGVEQVDLWLMHFPLKNPAEHAWVWDEFLAAAEQGMTAAVGVSNHHPEQLDALAQASGRMPEVNQVRFNPARYDPHLLAAHRARGVVFQGHSPLRKPGLDHPVLTEIAKAHGATPVQVVIAWHLAAHDIAVIPKSARTDRIISNLQAAGLHLTDDDITRINTLATQSRRTPAA
ncbi:aldo/keto reductase [Streptomyces sp. JJ66]|uniref:aldo/keto reductase n=1 Tax=Streptomyces sp. JJ66 TaxID=2803843 RepID=UPI001C5A1B53|nr:aldo/keto reductase [Streptomyces sp. JJ66]MBW1603901.1 aldo/keto reductase [Streptomyces sp. JJ66]